MPFQVLDIILLGIMLISGLLALMRGFTREVLSLVSWGLAAVAAWFAFQNKPGFDLVMPYVNNDKIAQAIIAAVAFLIVLIVVSVISVKISDTVIEVLRRCLRPHAWFHLRRCPRPGARRHRLHVLFLGQPAEKHEDWIRNAQTLPLIQSVSNMLISLMPPDIADTSSKTALPTNPEAPVTPNGTTGQGSTLNNGQQQGLDNLIDGATTPPAMGGSGSDQ